MQAIVQPRKTEFLFEAFSKYFLNWRIYNEEKKSRGVSGRANNPEKEARGKLKKSNNDERLKEVSNNRMMRAPNWQMMKPILTLTSDLGRKDSILIISATKGGWSKLPQSKCC